MSLDVNRELYRKAIHKTQTNKQRALTNFHIAKAQIGRDIPQLSQITEKINELGIKAARLSVLGENTSVLDEIFDEMNDLQQKQTELLLKGGYKPEDLLPAFTCQECNDTGSVNNRTCDCVHALVRNMRRESIEKTSSLKLCGFDTFELEKYPNTSEGYGVNARVHMADILNYCVQYAQNFTLGNTSIYMCGYAGLGKTHLALSIAKSVMEKGYNVVYVSAQQAFESVEKEHFGESGDTMQTMLNADLLILDDLGTEFISPYVTACLYNLINTRCNIKPTIYTSNIVNDSDLRRRYTEKIVSRLLGSCDVLTFCGEDIRLNG